MKRLLYAALILSMGAYAEEAAKVQEPAEASVEESEGRKDWPSLDEWAQDNKLKDGKLSAEILLGYEYSDLSDNGAKAAHALLTRTRLQYETANFAGFDAKIMGQYVGPLNDHYSSSAPAVEYDVIADPEAFRLHEAYLAYTGYDTHARIGAQEIILDNARFVGNVGWRFNAQSFNGGLVKNDSVDNLTLLYAYTDSINATDGDINHARQYHMFNGEYKLGENNNVSAFAYLQRNDNSSDIDTFGARLWGKNSSFVHNAMLAGQRDAYYGYLSGKLDNDTFDVELGIEYISGGDDSRERFQTLNGTAHAFNGWADQFLGTGSGNLTVNGGLIDGWLKAAVKTSDKMEIIGVYHYFNTALETATTFSGNYGNELDAMLKYKFNKNFDALTGIAVYIRGEEAISNLTRDENVFWLRGTFRF